MTRNEEIIRAAAANLRLEGMHVTDEEKRMAMDCLNGKMKFSDACEILRKRYKRS